MLFPPQLPPWEVMVTVQGQRDVDIISNRFLYSDINLGVFYVCLDNEDMDYFSDNRNEECLKA